MENSITTRIYDTAVIGATFLGIALAEARGDSIVIARGMTPGDEFIACLGDRPVEVAPMTTEKGQAFFEELCRIGAADKNGNLASGGALPLLAEHAAGCTMLYRTRVVRIEHLDIDKVFRVIICNRDGLDTVYARHVVDSTSVGVLGGLRNHGDLEVSKYLNAIVDAPAEAGRDSGDFYTNPLTGITVFRLQVPMHEGYTEAHARFLDEFPRRAEGCRLLWIANAFYHSLPTYYEKQFANNRYYASSASAGSCAAAFDRGCALALRM